MTKELPGGSRLFDFAYAAKNLIISYLSTVVLLFIVAAAAIYLTVPESLLDLLVSVSTGICVMWGGFRAARHFGRQGLLCGALSGVFYMLLLYVAGSLILGSFSFEIPVLFSVALGVGCGAIGGIVGVNTKSKRRK